MKLPGSSDLPSARGHMIRILASLIGEFADCSSDALLISDIEKAAYRRDSY